VVATLLSVRTLGTKLLVLVLAVLFVLPRLWAAVAIAFFADRAIEYSQAYAAFQIGVSEVLYPLSEPFLGGAVFAVWAAFRLSASAVGVISAIAKAWPLSAVRWGRRGWRR